MSLKDELVKLNTPSNKEIFDGKEKGDIKDIYGTVYTLENFAIMENEEYGEYVAFCLKEMPDKYFLNGGQVVLDKFKKMEQFKDQIKNEDVPILFHRVISQKRKGREYTDLILYPEE